MINMFYYIILDVQNSAYLNNIFKWLNAYIYIMARTAGLAHILMHRPSKYLEIIHSCYKTYTVRDKSIYTFTHITNLLFIVLIVYRHCFL